MPDNEANSNTVRSSNAKGSDSTSGRGLEETVRRVAGEHRVSLGSARRPFLLSFLETHRALLREAHRHFAELSRDRIPISYAGEWVLDNFYVIEQTLREIQEDMPQTYYLELPMLTESVLEGYPRAYALARGIVRHCQDRVDVESVRQFVDVYQRVQTLTTGELWALPTMLRLVTIENLSAALLRLAEVDQYDPKDLFPCPPLASEISDGERVARGMLSLHTLLNEDWEEWFESVSRVEAVLREDPAGVHPDMDFDTRDRYRKTIEELAIRAGLAERDVAEQTVRLAQEGVQRQRPEASGSANPGDWDEVPTDHVGFYLLDRGRERLESALNYRPSWSVRMRRWLRSHATLVYLSSITALSAILLGALVWLAVRASGSVLHLLVVALLGSIPVTTVAVDLVNWTVTRFVPPRTLPKLDFEDGIPPQHRTMVVVPSLLTSAGEVRSLLQQLELHYLGNSDPNLYFALLTDFGDAPEEHMPEDEELLEHACSGIEALNRQYPREGPGPFYLFHRAREWNPGEEKWMGWERKRGKLHEFNQLLLGNRETSFTTQLGDLDVLEEIKYVITLDADTSLPRESAHRLVGTLAHPLNRPRFDAESGSVVAGYTVLQPRTEIKPSSANQSWFARVFSGDTGLDLYSRAVSDVYQDLFGEGIYVGKGIYDVEAFEKCLEGRIPENTLLSHDLFEGIHGRAGLVTDIVLYEEYPPHYSAYTYRMHRWVRGDWQLLPWLLPQVPHATEGTILNDLSLLDRWKILDNLRRSLLAPTVLILLIVGWLWLPGSPLLWTLVGVLSTAVPVLRSLGSATIASVQDPGSVKTHLSSIWQHALRWLLSIVFVPFEAFLVSDAIASTLVRLLITRRHLLQWTTAAHTIRLFGRQTRVRATWMRMGGGSVLALGVIALVVLVDRSALPVAAPFLLSWLLSPQIAHWISQPISYHEETLSDDERQHLRSLARRTWLYFERFVGPDDHWLPPDHFQEDPRGLVAHRTSPTNIGLLLLSSVAAYDLGYIGALELSLRLRDTFGGLDGLERYRGHFLNWYDTRSLEPLTPRYVSTVDSGNLAACLLIVAQACESVISTPTSRSVSWQGLLDTLDVLDGIIRSLDERVGGESVSALRESLSHLRGQALEGKERVERRVSLLLQMNREGWRRLNQEMMRFIEARSDLLRASALGELRMWTERVYYHLSSMLRETDMLLPWARSLTERPTVFERADVPSPVQSAWDALVEALSDIPKLEETPSICQTAQEQVARLRKELEGWRDDGSALVEEVEDALSWCSHLDRELADRRMEVRGLLAGYRDLSTRAEGYVQEMQFRFLLDPQREVFYIGYNVAAEEHDNSYYDLLASEARIASLLAIAKGEVQLSHWLHMARPLTQVNGTRTLLSWSGTMFEYLMPMLFLQSPNGTLLDQSCRAAVERQIAYARTQGVPWGVSESGFYQFDANQAYQYRAFGVPGLGLKRGLGDDLVIAPYASLLALAVQPRAVVQNIDRLVRLGMLGLYGFYEAIDFTRSRLKLGQTRAAVRSYMAHHQGMILLSLANYLQNDAMVRRLHADPRIRSVELLLYEETPQQPPLQEAGEEETTAVKRSPPEVPLIPWEAQVHSPLPQMHLLSNGTYSVLITGSGAGYSRCAMGQQGEEAAWLTRWRADTTLEQWGTWMYIRDEDSGHLWSATYQPTAVEPEQQEVLFDPHKVEYRRRDHDISSRLEVTVSPGDNVEIRRLRLANHSERSRRMVVASYAELVLGPAEPDRRHQAFSKLFIESEYVPELNALIYRRRPRSSEEEPIYLAHSLILEQAQESASIYEGDRSVFLGRGGTVHEPDALHGKSYHLSGSLGATLDPIICLGQEIQLAAHARADIAYVTAVARSREEVMRLVRGHQTWDSIERVFGQARLQSQVGLQDLGLEASDVEYISKLFSPLMYPHPALRAEQGVLQANSKGQSSLWAYGISGDYPILLVRVNSQEGLNLVSEALQAHAFWRDRRFQVDLAILNQRETGYGQELQGQLERLIKRTDSDLWLNQRGGIFMLRGDQMSEADRVLLATAARAVLDEERGPLADQLARLDESRVRLPEFVPTAPGIRALEPTPPLERPTDLLFDNGWGGFSPDGQEYVIDLQPEQWTPAPWINVIANEDFGFLVSEAGSGYTWAVNSGENRLTPWGNDPVADPPGEAIYLRDEETAQIWTPTPLPIRTRAPYVIRHGAGYSVFEHHSHGLKQRLRLFAVPDAPVKVLHLRLENTWDRERRITTTYYLEWVLGVSRELAQQYVIPDFDAETEVLLARNPYNSEFGERVAFVAASAPLHGLTADRTEFLGRMGNWRRPAALGRVGLAGTVEPGLDPCAALQLHVDLGPGETKEVYYLLGQGADREEALQLVTQYQDPAQVNAAWEAVGKLWDRLLGAVQVNTPDQAMDLLLNRWLLYQALACRIWGRSALYQSSGAYGFRDQLQDVMALVHAAPELAREHIVRSARHQFKEGDVLHWWHPPSGRGVRTRISDDLLWLPFVVAYYVTSTGDESILHQEAPFLTGDLLSRDEEDRYGHYDRTEETFTIYEHCKRALDKGTTAGEHGLPLMGTGDWNDGMNRVAIRGHGESVWLGWFLYESLSRFAPLCDRMEDSEQGDRYCARAQELGKALQEHAWDGQWYRRAYYDDGTPLGSSENQECQIDSIAQSWAVLSGAGEPDRARQAMDAVMKRLVREEEQLILLFTPPFEQTQRDPGYIKGYPPGIRENGGQYTHAALWAVWAYAELGQGGRASALYRLLNPICHSDTAEKADRYRVEPYVVVADVYSVPPHVGRGGWTWYTGSAGWMYRLGLEAILGLRRLGDHLRIDPSIPEGWGAFEITYRYGGTTYEIQVENPDGVSRGVREMRMDGELLPDQRIPLEEGGRSHAVHVVMG